jgi:hypothetical protein
LIFPNAGEPVGPAAGLSMDGHGGHHDAGDYNRYFTIKYNLSRQAIVQRWSQF